MTMVSWVQILDKAVCISHSADILGEGMNPIIFLLLEEKSGLFNLGMATGLGEGKLGFQNC